MFGELGGGSYNVYIYTYTYTIYIYTYTYTHTYTYSNTYTYTYTTHKYTTDLWNILTLTLTHVWRVRRRLLGLGGLAVAASDVMIAYRQGCAV